MLTWFSYIAGHFPPIWVCSGIASLGFFSVAYKLWRDERKERAQTDSELKNLKAAGPKLQGTVSDWRAEGQFLFVYADLINTGAPTKIDGWEIVISSEGSLPSIEALLTPVDDGRGNKNNLLLEKGLLAPGDKLSGWLACRIDASFFTFTKQPRIDVCFKDFLGQQHVATCKPLDFSGSVDLPDLNPPQSRSQVIMSKAKPYLILFVLLGICLPLGLMFFKPGHLFFESVSGGPSVPSVPSGPLAASHSTPKAPPPTPPQGFHFSKDKFLPWAASKKDLFRMFPPRSKPFEDTGELAAFISALIKVSPKYAEQEAAYVTKLFDISHEDIFTEMSCFSYTDVDCSVPLNALKGSYYLAGSVRFYHNRFYMSDMSTFDLAAVEQSLIEAVGRPDSRKESTLENGFGATWEAVEDNWKIGPVTIQLFNREKFGDPAGFRMIYQPLAPPEMQSQPQPTAKPAPF